MFRDCPDEKIVMTKRAEAKISCLIGLIVYGYWYDDEEGEKLQTVNIPPAPFKGGVVSFSMIRPL